MKAAKGKTTVAAPWEPCEVSTAEIQAIQAMNIGEANKDQQRLVLNWLKRATAIGEMEFRPDDRESAFAGGKRFVGLQFFSLAKAVLPTK